MHGSRDPAAIFYFIKAGCENQFQYFQSNLQGKEAVILNNIHAILWSIISRNVWQDNLVKVLRTFS